MRRVLILGSSGSGKSTFARRLATLTGLPMVSIDAVFWQPGWAASDPATFAVRMQQIALGEFWIMDGNYLESGVGELRRARADAIFWFDLPRHACMTGILTRVARSYGRVRPEMAEGCPERFDPEFIRYVWTYRARQRPKLMAFLDGVHRDQSLVTFHQRAQADRYLSAMVAAGQAGVH